MSSLTKLHQATASFDHDPDRIASANADFAAEQEANAAREAAAREARLNDAVLGVSSASSRITKKSNGDGFNFFISRQDGETNKALTTRTESLASALKVAANENGSITYSKGRIVAEIYPSSTVYAKFSPRRA